MAGQHPFAAKYQKDVYKKNREGTIITDESKVSLLSPMGKGTFSKESNLHSSRFIVQDVGKKPSRKTDL